MELARFDTQGNTWMVDIRDKPENIRTATVLLEHKQIKKMPPWACHFSKSDLSHICEEA